MGRWDPSIGKKEGEEEEGEEGWCPSIAHLARAALSDKR
jgi:hypothetical protein